MKEQRKIVFSKNIPDFSLSIDLRKIPKVFKIIKDAYLKLKTRKYID